MAPNSSDSGNTLDTCFFCIHYYRARDPRWKPGGPRCDAFPEGIPLMIYENKVRHIDPYPGDHGIQYEPREGIFSRLRPEVQEKIRLRDQARAQPQQDEAAP